MTSPLSDIRVDVPELVAAGPGLQSWLSATLTCVGAASREVLVQFTGLDQAWTTGRAQSLVLVPGIPAHLQLPVQPSVGTPEGSYPVLVTVSLVDPSTGAVTGVALHAETAVVVGDASPLTMVLDPAEPTGVRKSKLALTLTNRSDAPMPVSLSSSSHPDLDVRLTGEVVVPARGSVEVRGRVLSQRRHLTGAPRRLGFVLRVQGRTTPLRLDATMKQKPFFNGTTTKIVAFVGVVAVWASLALVGIGQLSKHLNAANRASVTSTASPSASAAASASGSAAAGGSGGSGSGGSGSGGSGSGGSGSGGSGSGGSGSGGSGTAPATPAAAGPKNQVGGTVTGSDPAGVTVTLHSQSLVNEATSQAGEAVDYVGAAPDLGPEGKLVGSQVSLAVSRSAATYDESMVTLAAGTWAFGQLPAPAYYLLSFEKPGYQTRRYVVSTTVGGDPITIAVPLTAAQGVLSGQVALPSSGSAQSPSVQITVTDGVTSASTFTPTTGKVGAFTLSGISTPGTYLVTAQSAGYGAESQLVTLGPSGSLAGIGFALTGSTAQLSGTVLSSLGAGLGGATVTVSDGTTTRTVTTLTPENSSDTLAGTFTIPGLPTTGTSPYTVTISAPGEATTTQSLTLTGDTTLDTVTLQPDTGEVCGYVTLDNDTSDAVAGLVLTGDAGTFKTTSASGDGQFKFEQIPPGTYTLSVSSFQHTTQSVTTTIVAGGDVGCEAAAPTDATSRAAFPDFELTASTTANNGLPLTAQIVGHVLDLNTGLPLACPEDPADPLSSTCDLTVTDLDTPAPADQSLGFTTLASPVGPQGDYAVPNLAQPISDPDGLAPGVHRLVFSAKGYESQTLDVTVGVGSVTTAQLVTLAPTAEVTGTVTVPSGILPVRSCAIAVPVVANNRAAAIAVIADADTPQAVPPRDDCALVTGGRTTPVGSTPPSAYVSPIISAGGTFSYDLTGLPHGTYEISVIAESEVAAYEPVTPVPLFLSFGDAQSVNFTLDRLATLKVALQLVDPQGSPIPTSPTDSTPKSLIGSKVLLTGTAPGGQTITTIGAECTTADGTLVVTPPGQPVTVCSDSGLTLTGIPSTVAGQPVCTYTFNGLSFVYTCTSPASNPDLISIQLTSTGSTVGIPDVHPVDATENSTATDEDGTPSTFLLGTSAAPIVGRVVIDDPVTGAPTPVPGATVKVVAVSSYRSVNGAPSPVPVEYDLVTDSNGCWGVTTSTSATCVGGVAVQPGPALHLATCTGPADCLATQTVSSITVTGPSANGYTGSVTATGKTLSAAADIVINSAPVPVSPAILLAAANQPASPLALSSATTDVNGSGPQTPVTVTFDSYARGATQTDAVAVQASPAELATITEPTSGPPGFIWKDSTLAAGLAVPGIYHFTVAAACTVTGCTETAATGTVLVEPLPTPTAGDPPAAVSFVTDNGLPVPVTGYVSGTILSGGTPVAGATVTVGSASSAPTDSTGAYVVGPVTQTDVTGLPVTVSGRGYYAVTKTGLMLTASAPTGGRVINIQLATALTVDGTVQATITSTAANPPTTTTTAAAPVIVFAYHATSCPSTPLAAAPPGAIQTTTVGGAFQLPPAGGGDYLADPEQGYCVVAGSAFGFQQVAGSQAFYSTAAHDTAALTLKADPVTIHITVRDSNTHAQIQAPAISITPAGETPANAATTTTTGDFSESIGTYTITASDSANPSKYITTSLTPVMVTTQTQSSPVQEIEIDLVPTTSKVVVTTTTTASSYSVTLLDDTGNPVALANGQANPMTGGAGPVTFTDIPNGSYSVEATAPNYTTDQEPVSVPVGGADVPVTLSLTRAETPVTLTFVPSRSGKSLTNALQLTVTNAADNPGGNCPAATPCSYPLAADATFSQVSGTSQLASGDYAATIKDGAFVTFTTAVTVPSVTGTPPTIAPFTLPDAEVDLAVPYDAGHAAPSSRMVVVTHVGSTVTKSVDLSSSGSNGTVPVFVNPDSTASYQFTSEASTPNAQPYAGTASPLVALTQGQQVNPLSLPVAQEGTVTLTFTRGGAAISPSTVKVTVPDTSLVVPSGGTTFVTAPTMATCTGSGGQFLCGPLVSSDSATASATTEDAQVVTGLTVLGGVPTPTQGVTAPPVALVLPSATLTVTVRRDGQNSANTPAADVVVRYCPTCTKIAPSVSAGGVFTFSTLAPGTLYTVSVTDASSGSPAATTPVTTTKTTGAAGSSDGVTVQLPGLTLTVDDVNPVTSVTLTNAAGSVTSSTARANGSAYSFEFDDLAAGTYTITVSDGTTQRTLTPTDQVTINPTTYQALTVTD